MREHLVSYVLGDLAPAKREAVEEQLTVDPQLREELAQIRACLAGAALDEEVDCPPDLVHRTTHHVRAVSDSGCFDREGRALEPTPSCNLGLLSGWSLCDAVVATGVVLAMTLLLAPALRASRDRAQRETCENNLRQLGQALVLYAEQHGGAFPHIRPTENAGLYTLRLVEEGYAPRPELARWMLCPASQLAEASGCSQSRATLLPTLEEFHHARAELLAQLQRTMGGSYAYRIGYWRNGAYLPVPNLGDCRQALLSDAPAWREGELRSAAHGDGQNVLYQNGCVRFIIGCRAPGSNDHLFLNAAGLPAAGQSRRDAVLGSSEVTPVQYRPEGDSLRFAE